MDFASHLEQIAEQASALRAAGIAAGPDAAVPTCPEWTVQELVRHVARVHEWTLRCLRTDPAGDRPEPAQPPPGWEELVAWWDGRVGELCEELGAQGPDEPAWKFLPDVASTSAFWARRQAHETAIHRLDAEHALAGSDRVSAVPTLAFDPDLAADGIDELLVRLVPHALSRALPDAEGTVLFHAADAGRSWLVRLRPGTLPEIDPAAGQEAQEAADASVVGTADAVYRAGWRRPNTAIVTGDRTLLDALRTP